MAGSEGYRIADEPQPGAWAKLATNPIWPLFAMFFAGFWMALPWYLFNGQVIGSATRRQEALIAAGGLAGSFVVSFGIFAAYGLADLPEDAAAYLVIVVTVWKLGVSYWLYMVQARSWAIYQYFGGPSRNGLPVVLLAAFLLRPLVHKLLGSGFLLVVLV